MKSMTLPIIFIVGQSALAAKPVNFPGDVSVSRSPNGTFSIKNVDRDKEPYHQLLFQKRGSRAVRFYSYVRSVDVLWSPDSKAFIINDFMGSNCSDSFLFSTSSLSKPKSLAEVLSRQITNKSDLKSLKGNGHIYYYSRKWIDPKTIEIAVAGHDGVDPDGFTVVYQYKLDGSIKRIKRYESENVGP